MNEKDNGIPKSNKPILRIDSYLKDGDEISIFYDPMIAKFIVYSNDRNQSIFFLVSSLKKFLLMSTFKTNLNWLISLLEHPSFVDGDYDTQFLENHFASYYSNLTLTQSKSKEGFFFIFIIFYFIFLFIFIFIIFIFILNTIF